MDYIGQLARVLAQAKQKKSASVATGTASGNSVCINGRYYAATWGGDFDAPDGAQAECIIDGNKCVVVSVR